MSKSIGHQIYSLAELLWPINRSITGSGLRETLKIIKKNHIPNLKIKSVPSGTKVFDWTVPKEWEIDDAYIIDPKGKKICNFKKNNLHVVNYSKPVNKEISLEELDKHLHSLPEEPNAIPYITSYYKEQWGFCIQHKLRKSLVKGKYRVCIKSKLFKGKLNYGEVILKGKKKKEIFLSTYVCHPSLANNELSGPTVTTFLVKWLLSLKNRKYTYRIIFIPETIGSLVYLSKNMKNMKKNMVAGFNITCVGDDRCYSFLPSKMANTLSDRVASHVLKWTDKKFKTYEWSERGSDERQYCAPGIDLPVASIMRSKYGTYREYHTSLDILGKVVTPKGLEGGFLAIKKSIEIIEKNFYPKYHCLGEPQLGKRGLYSNLGKRKIAINTKLILDFLTWSDGKHSLLDIAEKLNIPIWKLYDLADLIKTNKLIKVFKH